MQRRHKPIQSELEFPCILLPYAFGGTIKKIFLRNKKPLEAKVFACYLYLHGPSFGQTQHLLEDLELDVAHSAIWYWLQQVGAQVGGALVKRKRRRCLVVDETKVRTKDGGIYVFGAVDPENRGIVCLLATKYRESVDALGFLSRRLRYCKGKPVIVTNGGPWYHWPAEAWAEARRNVRRGAQLHRTMVRDVQG